MSSTSASSRRVRHACLNCRRKKVKCDGEQPACGFCNRLLQTCVYPSRRSTIVAQKELPTNDLAWENLDYTDLALVESQMAMFGPISHSAPDPLSNIGGSTSLQPSKPIQTTPKTCNTDVEIGCSPNTSLDNETSLLPPHDVLMSTIDLYFDQCHNQPYCFFHEATFRYRLSTGGLPQFLILAVIAIASRFSLHPFYKNVGHNSAAYALRAWKETLEKSFDSENGADYRLVQAATLIAIHDFTACKHGKAWIKIGFAVSMAQAFHMMTEPSAALPFSAQEERRRTLWSIYLLDKLATSGRYRPSLFQDRTITLHLPCSETAFQSSIAQNVATLEEFPSLDDSEIESLKSSAATTIALASTLSAVTCYTFQHNKGGEQKLPWDHTSEYQAILSQLARFESFFDCFGDIQENIMLGPGSTDGIYPRVSESTIFSYVMYLLCHCLLQHPFLLRRRLENSKLRTPTSFLAKAIESSSKFALELTRTLKNARRAQYKISATFLNYAALVAGSIHSLFQHSSDGYVCVQSIEGVQDCLAHLNEKARYWPNSGRMTTALIEFSEKAAPFSSLLDPSLQTVSLESNDLELLYSLCDYGTMSTNQNIEQPNAERLALERNYGTPTQSWNTTVEDRDLSGHMDGILPQMFGYTDAQTMIENFSAALGQH